MGSIDLSGSDIDLAGGEDRSNHAVSANPGPIAWWQIVERQSCFPAMNNQQSSRSTRRLCTNGLIFEEIVLFFAQVLDMEVRIYLTW